jgi:hypothetical protein
LTKYPPRGIRHQGRPLKRLLEEWDRNRPAITYFPESEMMMMMNTLLHEHFTHWLDVAVEPLFGYPSLEWCALTIQDGNPPLSVTTPNQFYFHQGLLVDVYWKVDLSGPLGVVVGGGCLFIGNRFLPSYDVGASTLVGRQMAVQEISCAFY